ncbi:chitin synthase-domain-containing protein [Lactarius sanguifluus]|nr:chitin synthase-domain-containing protein [Lactarius sanguifluus]
MFLSVSDLNVSPTSLLHNQPCTDTFRYGDGNVDSLLGMRASAPSARSQVTVSLNMPRQYNAPDEDANNNIYYGRIPQRAPRHKTPKRIELFHGNFVLGSAMPTKLLNLYAYKDDEFTHMRYSAATGDRFTLRQVHYDPPRRGGFFIVMTMYNEDDTLFVRTMHGVMKNIAYLSKRPYNTIAVTESNKIEGAEKGILPVQAVFCMKERDQKRINSHSWFFNAFDPILQPNVCVLLDVGTRPDSSSIYHLWKALDINSNVGGACAAGADIFAANMYLAEDCELVSKRGGGYFTRSSRRTHRYSGLGVVVPELVSRRRRRLNCSFFAVIQGTVKLPYIYRSSHSFARTFWIRVELIYQTFNLIFSWFAFGNLFISFFVLTNTLEDPTIIDGKGIELFNVLLKYAYFAAILVVKGVQQVAAAKNRGATFSDLFANAISRNIVVSTSAVVGPYVITSIIHLDPWYMITSYVRYMLLAPSYINTLNVYAFANIHDASWETKGDDRVSTDLGVVNASKGENAVEVAVPTAETDISQVINASPSSMRPGFLMAPKLGMIPSNSRIRPNPTSFPNNTVYAHGPVLTRYM